MTPNTPPIRLLLSPWLFALLCCASSCTEDFFVDLEPLERELMGVWVAAERADIPTLARFTMKAQQRWQRTRQDLILTSLSPAERAALRNTDRWMAALDGAVENGDLRLIRGQLTELRATVRKLRAPIVADHPADLLYAFHEQWGWVSEISHDQMMCLVEWSEYEDAYREARSTWTRLQRTTPTYRRDLFPGYAARAADVELSATRLNSELDGFEDLLTTGNHTLATETTEAVRRRFFDYVAELIGYPGYTAKSLS